MEINILVAKWQSEFILVNQGGFSFNDAQNHVKRIIKEIEEHCEEILSDKLDTSNRTLLITNIVLYTQQYRIDISSLIYKILNNVYN